MLNHKGILLQDWSRYKNKEEQIKPPCCEEFCMPNNLMLVLLGKEESTTESSSYQSPLTLVLLCVCVWLQSHQY